MKQKFIILFLNCLPFVATAQTDLDAIMMSKNVLCTGIMYQRSAWDEYWEGTFKRNNENLGTVSTNMIGVMGNYGINHNLNVIFNLPYVQTKASAGVMGGLQGVQDLSMWVKWRAVHQKIGKGNLSVFALGGFSVPTNDYVADYLPLSIGLKSKTLNGRIMVDYEHSKFFATASGTYTYRSNIELDRTAYYTTQLHLTNEVRMPDMAQVNLRTGYRSRYLIAEAVLNNMTTLGGFDIRKNDMPFPSNRMNATMAGLAFKYTPKYYHHFSLVGNAGYVLNGRNVGQTLSYGAGIFYAFHVNGKGRKMGKKNYTPPPAMN